MKTTDHTKALEKIAAAAWERVKSAREAQRLDPTPETVAAAAAAWDEYVVASTAHQATVPHPGRACRAGQRQAAERRAMYPRRVVTK